MSYSVVEFSEGSGSGVALVNSKWLTPRKKEVFWPPFKQQKSYDKAVEKGQEPDESTWTVYPIKRCLYETDDYQKARQKWKEAESNSDLASEFDDNTGTTVLKKRVPRVRKISSSDEEDSRAYKRPVLPKPPKINIENIFTLKPGKSATTTDFRSPDSTFPSCSNGRSNSSLSTTKIASTSFPEENTAIHESSDNNQTNTSTNSTVINSNRTSPVSAKTDYELNKRILANVLYVKEQSSQILQLLQAANQNQSYTQMSNIPDDLPVNLPVDSEEDLRTLELYLCRPPENASRLISYMSTLGGLDITYRTNAILSHILTNKLATNYSFFGTRNGKLSFSKLNLNSVIIRSVKAASSNCTELDITNRIKEWLKHAKERHLKEEKKRQKIEEALNDA